MLALRCYPERGRLPSNDPQPGALSLNSTLSNRKAPESRLHNIESTRMLKEIKIKSFWQRPGLEKRETSDSLLFTPYLLTILSRMKALEFVGDCEHGVFSRLLPGLSRACVAGRGRAQQEHRV